MSVATAKTAELPAGIASLASRYDPDVIDVPGGRALVRLCVRGGQEWDARISGRRLRVIPARDNGAPDATIAADAATWRRVSEDVRGGMAAFQQGKLRMRGSLHLGVGLLAATSGSDEPGRLSFETLRTRSGRISVLSAGVGPETVLCLHGLGGTKASFLPTVRALAPSFRTIAVDLLGFGDSDKPLGASYGPEFQARGMAGLLKALELDRAHFIGHSMGGRVALELGFRHPEQTAGLVLMTPAMAWLRERRWAPYLRFVRPELGLLQVAPRRVVEPFMRWAIPGSDTPWGAPAVDEFVRIYTSARGRAALYAAARHIYLDEPYGKNGFWTRLRSLAPESLFIWGRHDGLVPMSFARHVERALPAAKHVEIESGHLPQFERPRETHAAIAEFLEAVSPTA